MENQVAKKPAIKITKATEARIAKKKEIAIKEASEEANKAFDKKRKTLLGLNKKVASKAKKQSSITKIESEWVKVETEKPIEEKVPSPTGLGIFFDMAEPVPN